MCRPHSYPSTTSYCTRKADLIIPVNVSTQSVTQVTFSIINPITHITRKHQVLSAVPTLSSAITRLPTELLLFVFSELSKTDPLNNLCLALTCKRLLQVSAALPAPLHIPSVSLHRPLPSTLYAPATPCIGMQMLLRRLRPVKPTTGRDKQTVTLCHDCLRYRPTRKAFWKADGKRWLALGEEGVVWEWGTRSWASKSLLQCPGCYCDERTAELARCGRI